MAKRTFKGLLQDLIGVVTDSKVPIRSVEFDPTTKRLRVEFDRGQPAAPQEAAQPGPVAERLEAERPRTIPGTTIPDDDSPIDALALAAERPAYDLDANGYGGGRAE